MCKLHLKLLLVTNFIFSIIANSPAKTQNLNDELLYYAHFLSQEGFHEESLVEYYRSVFFATDSLFRYRGYYGMGIQNRELKDWEKAEQSFKNAIQYAPTDSMKYEAQIALASVYVVSENYNLAILSLLPMISEQPSMRFQIASRIMLIICAVRQHNWKQAQSLYNEFLQIYPILSSNDSINNSIENLLSDANNNILYSPSKAKLLSTIIPGTGQMYVGDYRNGLNSFILNSFNFWVIGLNIVKADYLSAALYFIFVTERYYAGNRYRAEQITISKNEETENKFEKEILLKLSLLYDSYK